jgi:cis-3-alkyl-4-acyloxetan-2-one decarboxylase
MLPGLTPPEHPRVPQPQAQALIEAQGFTPRFFTRDGLSMHYLDEGKGEPVLMVHGNPSWCWLYRDVVKALRGSHRCIVPDHIGMGLSDRPDDARYRYTLDSRVADLEALVERTVGEEPVTLIVHDWGGAIGCAWAVRHPERVRRLVVLNTAAFPMLPGKRLPGALKLVRNTAIGAFLVERLNAFALGTAWIGASRRLGKEERAAYVAPYDNPVARRAVLRFVQDIPLGEGDPAWQTLVETGEGLAKLADKPALILWGLKDFVFDRDYFDEWCRRFPRAEAIGFADAGHYVLEDAGETCLARIGDFLGR